MDATRRRRIEEYVRPIAVGLDGVTYFGDAERVARAAERIAGEDPSIDRDVVYLLAMFSGQSRWVSRLGQRSRTEIFLASAGIPAPAMRALFRGLPRLASGPRTAEEAVVHDALKLEALGATGIARLLLEGYRERQDFLEMADGDRGGGRAWRSRPRRAGGSPSRGAKRCAGSRISSERNTRRGGGSSPPGRDRAAAPASSGGHEGRPYGRIIRVVGAGLVPALAHRSPCPPSTSRICPVM